MALGPVPGVLAPLALGVAVAVFAGALLAAPLVLADWHAYYRAAAALRAGADIYAEAKALVARNSYDFWINTDGQYVYPPLLALAVLPLTALDIGKGGDVWLGLLALATAGFLWATLAALGRPIRLATLTPPALPVLASVPLLLGVRYGQVDVLLLLLTTLALLAHVRGRDVPAGIALGLAAAVKPTLAVYGLFFLRKRRWTALTAAAATGLVAGLGPFLLLGPAALGDWWAIARYFTGSDYPSYPSNQSALGFLLRAFAGGPRHAPLLAAPWLAQALWLVVAAGALVLWWRFVAPATDRDRRSVAEWALTAVLMLLIAPLSEDIHYVALLLPLAALADRAAWGPAGPRWTALAVLACLYFVQPWLDFAYNRGGTDLRRLLASGAYLYGLLLVGLALVWGLARRRAVMHDA